MKTFKIISNLLLLIAAVFLGYSYVNKRGIFSNGVSSLQGDKSAEGSVEEVIGVSFNNLTNQYGNSVSSADFIGKHMLVVFGFSTCKRTCPIELGMASQVLSKLGDSAEKLQVVFISIDPERDTVERLSEYHKAFDSRIQMLTGDKENIRSVVESYKVYVADHAGSDGDIDHSSLMYLVGPDGKYAGHFAPDFNESESQFEQLFALVSGHVLNS